MQGFDIAPFGLPGCASDEVRFEETRDVERVVVTFAGPAPRRVALHYLRKAWPHSRVEQLGDMDTARPSAFGWIAIDDWFNTKWHPAKAIVVPLDAHSVEITFTGLAREFDDYPGREQYDVTFRRTLGVKVEAKGEIAGIAVYTRSVPAQTAVRFEFDAGKKTPGTTLQLTGYNARVAGETAFALPRGTRAPITVAVEHMTPAHRYAYDDGHLLCTLDRDAFTISLPALAAEGPIWYPDAGLYIAHADDPTTFADYRARITGARTIAEQVCERPEQSLAGAMHGQPRPHPIPFCFGCKHTRQKFWLEPNGDLLLKRWLLQRSAGRDTARCKTDGDGRFFFGLERWIPIARYNDPYPALAYNIQMKRDELLLEQQCFAVPLASSILAGEPAPDDAMVALVRFRVRNTGDAPATVRLPVHYSQQSDRANAHLRLSRDACSIPRSERAAPPAAEGRLESAWHDEMVLRARYETTMIPVQDGADVIFTQQMAPGESCELLLKVPFIALEGADELAQLAGLRYDACYREMTQYWRSEGNRGARLRTPDAHLNAAYRGHLPIVLMADFGMADGSGEVNTSVGAITYGNYTNESCMILQELDQRGLHDEVRRRLAVWVHYQSTVWLRGNFTDKDGLFFGAGGLESGSSYDQHHGWALWYLAEHFLLTRDEVWFAGVTDAVVRGAEWIIRQRRNTSGTLPHSRGWERGFLPAGALEDVDDYFYWLSTNVLTWRGLDTAARALAVAGHPAAARIQRDANAYRKDLIRGFETARRHAPLIRLRDGRWIPHYPSRLYRRGRDFGWIREVLEGSIYLLLSGLYASNSREAKWILDDYQDTRYMTPPFGYYIHDTVMEWFDRGGFSVQPNLLEGLRPYLDRDEPELYLWMFFNAWAACYREEVNAMVEHPLPVLGFSNNAPMKTSDEANAMKWLCFMFVYTTADALLLGRALPRAWFADAEGVSVEKVVTRFGTVSVRYHPDGTRLVADAALDLHTPPATTLLRFRHPDKLPIRTVTVNGQPHDRFDSCTGDVDISGVSDDVRVIAEY